ncbi:MAG: type II CRISPR RNA-guided endonuclease Cas9, partial [Bacteroidetes bacterium]
MTKILGLDLGTNSIGWAVTEKNQNKDFTLIDKGVRIFQEGIKIEKGQESSKAAERTEFRSARRIKYRRKLRKIALLKTLSQNGFCPELTKQELDNWRYQKIYPSETSFLNWQKTDHNGNKNPYYFRALAVEQKLDLSSSNDRYKIGRAFYHIAQRRGFLSNRLNIDKESEGVVATEIEKISEEKGDKTLGQYFYELYQKGEKIRSHYTHREKHYLDEFERICRFQQLPDELVQQLRKDIFYQRPLKSQKGMVGNCPFEKNKPRCPVSHPHFEEFRMYSFINNIQIKSPEDDHLRILTEEERALIIPLFYRKSKEHFNFEEIAKKITPKGVSFFYHRSKNNIPESYLFNYPMRTSVSGCKSISQLRGVFGDDWREGVENKYLLKRQKTGSKSIDELVNDIWHVLFNYNSTERLFGFAKTRLGFNDDEATRFSKISLKKDYASLSLKAINKILPYLKDGLIYSHAVFMAKLEDLIPKKIWEKQENKALLKKEIHRIIQSQNQEKQLADIVNGIIKTHRDDNSTWSENEFWQETLWNDIQKKLTGYLGKTKWENMTEEERSTFEKLIFQRIRVQMSNNLGKGEYLKTKRIDERVKEFISDHFEIDEKTLEKLYHPSATEVYQDALRKKDGKYYLGSPLISSIRNPMAMRSLHQVRKVVNELIKEGTIDRETKINIEMARDLKNANERKALQQWQRLRETEREEYKKQLRKDIKAATGRDIEPGERDILKYQLWEEQNHICLYTGETIAVSEFIGDNPKYDIEHTIPRSLSLDNSQVNLTLCNNEFNRKIKRNKIPYELPNHSEILKRIEYWKEYIAEAQEGIERAVKKSRANSDNKVIKDKAIQQRHFLKYKLDYWKQKYRRFEMNDVPDGFKNSQLVDTGIITKYARLYLKTVFNNVYTVKGQTVSDFRKMWGIQPEYKKKERINHIHHCIDAITMACMTKESYEELAKAYHEWEGEERISVSDMPSVEKPWPTFSEDVKEVENEVLISH